MIRIGVGRVLGLRLESRTPSCRALGALAVTAAFVALAPRPVVAAAAPASPPVSTQGICALTAGSAQFQPAMPSVVPATVGLNISASGTCVGSAGLTTVTMSFSGSMLASCLGGTGSANGGMAFSGAPGGISPVVAQVVAGPATLELVVSSTSFTGDLVLAWDSAAAAVCALGGTASTSVAGVMLFTAA